MTQKMPCGISYLAGRKSAEMWKGFMGVSFVNLNPPVKAPNKAALRRRTLRDQLWSGVGDGLWHRTTEDGFSTVPRTLPLVMTLIDDLKGKGRDISRVYFDLWCRQLDDSFVEVTDEEAFAYSSGYSTPGRNVRSWRERIETLRELGFVSVQPNGSRKYGYILLHHPHRVVLQLRAQGRVGEAWWGAFSKRANEIGAELPVF
jgi:hypothetical protein